MIQTLEPETNWINDIIKRHTPIEEPVKERIDLRPQIRAILFEVMLERYFEVTVTKEELTSRLSFYAEGFEFAFRENLTLRSLELMLVTNWENDEPKGKVIETKEQFEKAVYWFLNDPIWAKTYPRRRIP